MTISSLQTGQCTYLAVRQEIRYLCLVIYLFVIGINIYITQQIKIFNKFQNKIKTHEIKMNEKQTNETNTPCDPSDLLFFVRVVMD